MPPHQLVRAATTLLLKPRISPHLPTFTQPMQKLKFPLLQQTRPATTSESGAFLPDPERENFGLFGVTATVAVGLLLGATSAKNIAAFLEENELFVPSDDDDDD